ncbi:MAG: membrane protein insertase YidC, partial [Candidatus Methylomirabilota bacterium]
MERNAILATVLVILILLGYQWYVAKFETPPPAPAAQSVATPPAASGTAPATAAPAPTAAVVQAAAPAMPRTYTPTAQSGVSPREVTVETPLLRVVLTTAGAKATHWQLKSYRVASGELVDLVTPSTVIPQGPLSAWADQEQAGAFFEVDRASLDLKAGDESARVTFTNISSRGIQLTKTLVFRADRYDVGVEIAAKNLAEADQTV